LKNIHEFIYKAEFFISKLFLAAITFLVFGAAVARTLGFPIVWAVDGATFLFAWCVFFGADLAIKGNKLMAIDLLTKKLPVKIQHYLKLTNLFIIVVFLIFLIVYGTWLSYTTRFRTFQGIPGFSYTWVTISVPIGSALMLSTILGKIKEQLAWKKTDGAVITGNSKELI